MVFFSINTFFRYYVTVRVSYLQPYKVRTFTTCLAFPPWCSRYTVQNKVGADDLMKRPARSLGC